MNKLVCEKCRKRYFESTLVFGWSSADEEYWRGGHVACPYKYESEDEFTKKLMFSTRIGKKFAYCIRTNEIPENCKYKLEHLVMSDYVKIEQKKSFWHKIKSKILKNEKKV